MRQDCALSLRPLPRRSLSSNTFWSVTHVQVVLHLCKSISTLTTMPPEQHQPTCQKIRSLSRMPKSLYSHVMITRSSVIRTCMYRQQEQLVPCLAIFENLTDLEFPDHRINVTQIGSRPAEPFPVQWTLKPKKNDKCP